MDASSSPLRQAARRGVRWTSAAAVAAALTQLVQTLVLLRLLDPHEFGLMAAAMVIVGLADAVSDFGVGAAVVVRDIPERALSSLMWGGLSVGLVVAAIVAATSGLVADFYGEPEVRDLLLVSTAIFLLNPLGNVHQGLRERALDFEAVAKIDVAGSIAGFVTAVGAAAAGVGALSLVLGLVAGAAVRNLLFVASGWRQWRPVMRLRASELKTHLSFGAYQTGDRSIGHLFANIDYVLIGRFLGTEALGFYSIAYQLVVRPLFSLNPILTRVAMPVFAQRQSDDAALRRGWLELSRLIALVVAPLLALLAVAAPALVPVAFGDRWEPSIELIQILAGVGILQALSNPLGALLLAKDRPDLGFALTATMLPVMGVAIYLVVEEGTEAVAWTYLAVTAVAFLVAMPWLLRRVVGLRPLEYARALARPAALTIGAAALALAAYAATKGASDAVTLAATGVAGGCAYVGLLLMFERSQLAELRSLVRPGAV